MNSGVPLILIAVLAACMRGSDGVSCYGAFNANDGTCLDFIGNDVSQEDCCMNMQYGFKHDGDSPCEACYPAEWSEWSEWGPCSVSCTEGVQQRHRACNGQGECVGQDKIENRLQARACSLQDCCPADGGWSNWTPWSPCSVTCKVGTMERRRSCSNPAPVCGGTCEGDDKQVAPCDTKMVCPTHGDWGSWGAWGECSQSCADEGSPRLPMQIRQRECNNPAPSRNPPGNPCPGSDKDVRDCSGLPFCPVDGQWGEWQKNFLCSVTCGIGRETETRECNNPAPRHGGRYCVGSPKQTRPCNTGVNCPIDGRWSEWSKWSTCERPGFKITCTKRSGLQKRTRSCERRDFGGKACNGSIIDNRSCYNINFCSTLDKEWGEWSEWGLCLPPCGESKRSRVKNCEPIYPDYPNTTGIEKINFVYWWGTPNILCEPLDAQRRKVEEFQPCHNVIECDDSDDFFG